MIHKNLSIALISTMLAVAGCKDETTCPAVKAEEPRAAASEVTPAVTPAAVQPAAAPAGTEKAEKPAVVEKTDEPEYDVDIDADLRVKRLVLAQDVENREPVKPATEFTKKDASRIFAFVEVGNPDQKDSEIFVSFKPAGGKEGAPIRLRVGASPRWRTWATTQNARSAGTWEVIVRNPRGEIIGKQSFTVLADDPYAGA